jgi:flavin-dependent dehydrogenase
VTVSVAVVGAGPAGAFCAARLAASGNRVTIYDPSHPREKPCGGGVTAGVFRRWPELQVLQADGRPSWIVRMRGGRGRELAFPMEQPIYVFSRRVFDGRLLEMALAAGATLRPARVRAVTCDPEGVSVDLGAEVIRHDFVVGADGASSIVRRSLLGETPGGQASYATAGFHVAGLGESDLYVEFTRDYPGYLWVFPRPDHCSVGIAAPIGRENGAQLRARVLGLLERRYPGSLDLPRVPYGASIPVGDGPVAGPRFALVGDAAAANDAITGEGIHHAIDSGGILADALAEAGADGAPALYARRWADGPGGELAACLALARRLYRPVTVDLSMALAARNGRIRRLMAAMPTAELPYRGLWRRILRETLLGRA